MKNRSLLARAACGLLFAAASLGLTACKANYYEFPQYNFAGRPIPPSKLANRVMVAIDNPSAFSGGSLQILDANRDLRSNVENTIPYFMVSGYSGRLPTTIASFPEQLFGYVYGSGDGSFTKISYSTESTAGAASGLPSTSDSIGVTSSVANFYAASGALGGVIVVDNTLGKTYSLNLPGAQHVMVNPGNTVALVTQRNTNNLYRIVRLVNNVLPPTDTYTDCEPLNLPAYCVVPVQGTFARPNGAVFSLDGSSAYVLNCGAECGDTTAGDSAGVTFLNTNKLLTSYLPVVGDTSPMTSTLAVPGGATVGLTDGYNLYVAGQELMTSATATGKFAQFSSATGYFTGVFSIISLGTAPAVTNAFPIPDGTHTTMLFADDNTLWMGSTLCQGGARGYLAGNVTTTPGAVNLNCLAVFTLGGTATPTILPAISAGNPVPYPNQNTNQYYYGDLTGICWVQNLHKVYSAYGGQVHAFNTATLGEIDNQYITIQGTAMNVVYMDALTNAAN
ncbi:MAG TPA: hypothetical protein VGB94_13860 [Acidobacteriaceae bacterium]